MNIFIDREEREKEESARVREIVAPLVAHDIECAQCRAAGSTPLMCEEGKRLQSAAYRKLDSIAA